MSFKLGCQWNGNPTRGGDSRVGATNSAGAQPDNEEWDYEDERMENAAVACCSEALGRQ